MNIVRVRECSINKTIGEITPAILPAGYFRYFRLIIDIDGDLAIDSNAYAGIIPCKNDIAIQLDPKFAVSDLTYLLLKGGELSRSLDTPFDDTVAYQIAEDSIDSFFEALVSSFLTQIDIIKRLGLIRSSEAKPHLLPQIKGKPDFSQLGKEYSESYGLKVRCLVTENSLNNPANRVLLHTLKYLTTADLLFTKRREIIDRMEYFTIISRSSLEPGDIAEVTELLEKKKIPSSRRYYIPALNLARLILQGAGITLGEMNQIKFRPLLIDTSKMFESYIRAVTREAFEGTAISVLTGMHFPRFFYDEAPNRLSLTPDIVLTKGADCSGIIDVKYKNAPTSSDHYQMWAYLRGYEAQHGCFVSATNESKSKAEYFRKDEKKVCNYSFSLTNIQSSEREFITFLKDEFV